MACAENGDVQIRRYDGLVKLLYVATRCLLVGQQRTCPCHHVRVRTVLAENIVGSDDKLDRRGRRYARCDDGGQALPLQCREVTQPSRHAVLDRLEQDFDHAATALSQRGAKWKAA